MSYKINQTKLEKGVNELVKLHINKLEEMLKRKVVVAIKNIELGVKKGEDLSTLKKNETINLTFGEDLSEQYEKIISFCKFIRKGSEYDLKITEIENIYLKEIQDYNR